MFQVFKSLFLNCTSCKQNVIISITITLQGVSVSEFSHCVKCGSLKSPNQTCSKGHGDSSKPAIKRCSWNLSYFMGLKFSIGVFAPRRTKGPLTGKLNSWCFMNARVEIICQFSSQQSQQSRSSCAAWMCCTVTFRNMDTPFIWPLKEIVSITF